MSTSVLLGTGQVYSFDTQGTVPPKYAFANVAAGATDTALVTAVTGKKIRVLGFILSPGATATAVTFNSKPAGAGTAKSALFTSTLNSTNSSGFNVLGWFETVISEGLTITTGAGTTVGIQVCYVEV